MSSQHTYWIAFARYPALRLTVFFVAGIVGAEYFGGSRAFWWIFVTGMILVYAGLEIWQRRTHDPYFRQWTVVAYLLVVTGAGGLHHHGIRELSPQEKQIQRFGNLFSWDSATFHGRITKVSPGREKISLTVLGDSVSIGDTLAFRSTFRMLVHRKLESPNADPRFVLGDVIGFRGTVYPVDAPRNPHQFDYKSYLARKGIHIVAGMDELLYIQPAKHKKGWLSLRRYVHGLIERGFTDESVPLAKAILIGEKKELTDQTRQSFARTGLAHVMAVSGMHVGFLVAPFWFLIPWFWRFRMGKLAGLVSIAVILFVYAGITGFSASVVRASLTAVLLAYGKLYHRRRDSINLTAMAALILLARNPEYLFQIGFQLSFGAVFTILMVWPLIDGKLLKSIKKRWWHQSAQLFLLSLVVQIGLLPLLARYFGEISLIGPLINMAVVVCIGLMVQVGLLGLVITSFLPGGGRWLLLPVDQALLYLQRSVETAAGWSWSWMTISGGHPLWEGLWMVILIALASIHMPWHRWKWVIVALGLVCTWQVERGFAKWKKAQVLRITALDVGQGDALVVQTPMNKTILIDTGRWSPGYNSGTSVLLPYLAAEGVDTLDAVFLSHPHADHIGGMEAVLKQVPVRRIYHSGADHTSNLYHRMHSLARERKVQQVTVGAGRQLSLDPSVRMFVLAPSAENRMKSGGVNDASLILRIQYGQHGFLFMGDAERMQERWLLQHYGGGKSELVRSDYLKVGHHGSNTSSTVSLLEQVQPDISVVSVAPENRYGHPHPEAVQRLGRWTSDTLHFTGRDRAVIYESDGQTLRLVNWDNQQF